LLSRRTLRIESSQQAINVYLSEQRKTIPNAKTSRTDFIRTSPRRFHWRKEFHRRGVEEKRLDYLLAKKTISFADWKEMACRLREMADRLPKDPK
jgi:hypothetical protein